MSLLSRTRRATAATSLTIGVAVVVLLGMGKAAAQSENDAIVVVQPGDTFSGIAARYLGSAAGWRKLYRPDATGLADPNRIDVGMRFELLSDGAGRYLRLVGGSAGGVARTAAATAPAAASPAPPAAQTAQPSQPSRSTQPAQPAQPRAAAPVEAAAAVPAVPPAAMPAVPATAVATDSTLVIGVLPNIPAATLAGQYERLKRYLERVEGGKVRIVIPSGFKAFFDNTMNGDYDLAVAAPHFARVAQVDRNFIPLVMVEPRINALFVAATDSSIGSWRDVRERPVAFANPTSLVAMYGVQWLARMGLEGGRDYEVKSARTDLGVGRMVLIGEAAAAVLSNGEFRSLPPEESSRLKVVEVFARLPNFVVVAHPRIDRDRQARLKSALKAFLADAQDGVAFAEATGYSAIVDADESQLRELDAFNAQTRRTMGFTP